jgi:hypothetical protein
VFACKRLTCEVSVSQNNQQHVSQVVDHPGAVRVERTFARRDRLRCLRLLARPYKTDDASAAAFAPE